MAVDPDIAALIVWAGQVFLILACGLVLIGAVAIMGFFFTATVGKRHEARMRELGAELKEYEEILGGIKATLEEVDADTHTHPPTHTSKQTPEDKGPKLDGQR